jgi:subtilase family serine protease
MSTTLHVPASTAAGSYYILAKADWNSAVAEGIETNNLRASTAIRIGPDLIVSALTVPASAAPGSTISVSDTTKNQGAGGADASTTRFYLSANTSLDASDVMLGSRSVPSLAGGVSDAVSTVLTVPAGTASGTYSVIAQADAANAVPETGETNNNRSATLKIGIDLVLTAVAAPSSTAAGAMIIVTDTTKNQGLETAPPTSTGFYLSVNGSIDSTDVFLGSRAVGELPPGATSSGSVPLQISPDTLPGSYYVVGEADWGNAVAESSETNNPRSSTVVRVGPDLIITTLTAPLSAVAGAVISASDTTKNQGGGNAPASVTSVYLSTNSSLGSGDVLLGTRAVPLLAPGLTDTGSTPLLIPASTAPGTYYIVAKTDGGDAIAEALENNNLRARTITIAPPP